MGNRHKPHQQRRARIFTGTLQEFAESTQYDANNHGVTQTRWVYSTQDPMVFMWVDAAPLSEQHVKAFGLSYILAPYEPLVLHANQKPRAERYPQVQRANNYRLKDNQWPSN